MDTIFEQGIRGRLPVFPLNSYENRVYQFQDEDRWSVLSSNFIALKRWTANRILKEHQFALQLVNDEVAGHSTCRL
ncbi:hypothetical protein ACNKHW_24690 [Shigella flexneri]